MKNNILMVYSNAKKFILWAGICLLLYTVIGFFVLPPIVKSVSIGKLSQILKREVAIDKVQINPFKLSIKIIGFSIKEKGATSTFFSFQSLYLNLQTSSLIRGGPVIREIQLSAPQAFITRNNDLSYNFSDLLSPQTQSQSNKPEKPFVFSLNNIQIHNGTIDFEDLPKKTHHTVKDIEIAIPFLSNLPKEVEIFVQPLFQANVNGTPVALKGKSKPFTDTVESSVAIKFQNFDLAKYAEYIPIDLGFRLDSGKMDSDLTVSYVQIKDRSPILMVIGGLTLKQISLLDRLGQPMVGLDLLEVKIASANVFAKNIRLNRILLQSPRILVSRNKRGKTNIGSLGGPSTPETQTQTAASSPGKGHIHVEDVRIVEGRLTVSDEPKGKRDEVLKIPEFSIKETAIDLKKQTITVGQIITQGGVVSLRRERNGEFNLASLVSSRDQPASSEARTDAAPGKPEEAPWIFTLNHLSLERYKFVLEDRVPASSAQFVIYPVNLTAENVSTEKSSIGKSSLQLTVNKTGTLSVNGSFGVNPVSGDLVVEVRRFPLVPLQPYISERLDVILMNGVVSTQGHLTLATTRKNEVSALFTGAVQLLKFGTIERNKGGDLIRIKSLQISGIRAAYHPTKLQIKEINLTDFSSRIAIDSDGELNLKSVIKTASQLGQTEVSSKKSSGSTLKTKPSEPLPIKIGRMTLRNGTFNFNDHFIQPNYNMSLTEINGTISGLSSNENDEAEINIETKIDGIAPVVLTGKMNLLSDKLFLDATLDSKDFELAPLTPYSSKFAGYKIQKGKLFLNLKYLVQNRNLNSENKVFLDQFTWGDKVESPDATKLPVRLAISLLTDRKGQIHLDIPVTGSLDDPKFSIWRIVLQVIKNLLIKVATSPFSLLASIAGGGEELSYVEFNYGSFDLNKASEGKLKMLSTALYDRPALKMAISGDADSTLDREALRKMLFLNRLKIQKMNDLNKKGENVTSLDEVVINPDEYVMYLTKAYKKETFSKPRNFLGFPKDLPPPEMEKLMMTNIKVTEEDLRNLASRRAIRVKEELLKSGLEPERIFLVEGELTDTAKSENQKGNRVNFSIK